MKWLALLFFWLTLASFAQPVCDEANAAYVIRETVVREIASNGATVQVPVGQAAAWSCVSREDAEQELTRQKQHIP